MSQNFDAYNFRQDVFCALFFGVIFSPEKFPELQCGQKQLRKPLALMANQDLTPKLGSSLGVIEYKTVALLLVLIGKSKVMGLCNGK